MACVPIIDEEKGIFCFSCNTTDYAFGPLMNLPDNADPNSLIESFRNYLGKDPRTIDDEEIRREWYSFLREEGFDD